MDLIRLTLIPDFLSTVQFIVCNLSSVCTLLLSVVDSMGKPGSGILDGNLQWLGSFEQCKAATDGTGTDVSFNTQYCLAPVVTLTYHYWR